MYTDGLCFADHFSYFYKIIRKRCPKIAKNSRIAGFLLQTKARSSTVFDLRRLRNSQTLDKKETRFLLNREEFNPGKTMWSDEIEENPPFHDFCKVYVHYCSRLTTSIIVVMLIHWVWGFYDVQNFLIWQCIEDGDAKNIYTSQQPVWIDIIVITKMTSAYKL